MALRGLGLGGQLLCPGLILRADLCLQPGPPGIRVALLRHDERGERPGQQGQQQPHHGEAHQERVQVAPRHTGATMLKVSFIPMFIPIRSYRQVERRA